MIRSAHPEAQHRTEEEKSQNKHLFRKQQQPSIGRGCGCGKEKGKWKARWTQRRRKGEEAGRSAVEEEQSGNEMRVDVDGFVVEVCEGVEGGEV